ncbi:MAG: endolytic transglycosylase MltG [Campylobacterota bacterium]|nr:endolytic transglycosylase MltG [Campylobacterota bacterium]
MLYIPKGNITQIISHLQSKNFDLTRLDNYIVRFIGYPQQGWIDIGSHRLSHADFLYRLTTAKAALVDVTLIPGETTYFFLNDLAQQLNLDRRQLQLYFEKYAPLKEGAFVAETYKLPLGITEKKAIKILLYRSREQMRAWSEKIFGTFDEKKWFHFVTLASVLQKEAASIEDMSMVSSVIYNRLSKGMRLQMDGTLNYGKYSHTKVTAKRIREELSSYNTYKYKGLPPLPVCNVGIDAVKAAIFPAKSEYLYFVRGKNGQHQYSRYYSTHKRNIANATK